MEAFTDRWADHFSRQYEESPLAKVSWFTGTVSPALSALVVDGTLHAGQHVVDLGCGPGVHAAFLACHGMTVTGIDRSTAVLAFARRYIDLLGLDVTLMPADILATGLPTGQADVVHDSFVYHNVRTEARNAYVAEAARLLKPQGLFVLAGFSDWMTPGSGPIRLSSDDILDAFLPRFRLEELRRFRNLPTAARPDQWHWLGLFRRRSSSPTSAQTGGSSGVEERPRG